MTKQEVQELMKACKPAFLYLLENDPGARYKIVISHDGIEMTGHKVTVPKKALLGEYEKQRKEEEEILSFIGEHH